MSFFVLVKPSGCGKAPALRMIAGLETITNGEIRIGDRVVDRIPSPDRDIVMVFQNHALYPHLEGDFVANLLNDESARTRRSRWRSGVGCGSSNKHRRHRAGELPADDRAATSPPPPVG